MNDGVQTIFLRPMWVHKYLYLDETKLKFIIFIGSEKFLWKFSNIQVPIVICYLNLKGGARLVEALRYKPEGRGTMAVGSTQPLIEMTNRDISFLLKSAFGWQPHHTHAPVVLKYGSLNLLEPSEPVQTYTGIALPNLYMYVRHFCIMLLRGLSPRANYTDRAAAAGRRS